MMHEVLIALAGFPGDVFVYETPEIPREEAALLRGSSAAPPAPASSLAADASADEASRAGGLFLHPQVAGFFAKAEQELLTRLVRPGFHLMQVRAFIAAVEQQTPAFWIGPTGSADSRPPAREGGDPPGGLEAGSPVFYRGLYVSAMARAMDACVEEYLKKLVDIETQLLLQPLLPLTALHALLATEQCKMETLYDIVCKVRSLAIACRLASVPSFSATSAFASSASSLPAQSALREPAQREESQTLTVSCGALLDFLWQGTRSGNSLVQQVYRPLLDACVHVFIFQLSSWLLAGQLLDPFGEFFLARRSPVFPLSSFFPSSSFSLFSGLPLSQNLRRASRPPAGDQTSLSLSLSLSSRPCVASRSCASSSAGASVFSAGLSADCFSYENLTQPLSPAELCFEWECDFSLVPPRLPASCFPSLKAPAAASSPAVSALGGAPSAGLFGASRGDRRAPLPTFLPPAGAATVVFVGKAVRVLTRSGRWTEAQMQHLRPLVARMRRAFRHPASPASVILPCLEVLRRITGRLLWELIADEAALEEQLLLLHDFFLLGNGHFFQVFLDAATRCTRRHFPASDSLAPSPFTSLLSSARLATTFELQLRRSWQHALTETASSSAETSEQPSRRMQGAERERETCRLALKADAAEDEGVRKTALEPAARLRASSASRAASATPRSATPRSATPRSATPRSATPRSATPPSAIVTPRSRPPLRAPCAAQAMNHAERNRFFVARRQRATPRAAGEADAENRALRAFRLRVLGRGFHVADFCSAESRRLAMTRRSEARRARQRLRHDPFAREDGDGESAASSCLQVGTDFVLRGRARVLESGVLELGRGGAGGEGDRQSTAAAGEDGGKAPSCPLAACIHVDKQSVAHGFKHSVRFCVAPASAGAASHGALDLSVSSPTSLYPELAQPLGAGFAVVFQSAKTPASFQPRAPSPSCPACDTSCPLYWPRTGDCVAVEVRVAKLARRALRALDRHERGDGAEDASEESDEGALSESLRLDDEAVLVADVALFLGGVQGKWAQGRVEGVSASSPAALFGSFAVPPTSADAASAASSSPPEVFKVQQARREWPLHACEDLADEALRLKLHYLAERHELRVYVQRASEREEDPEAKGARDSEKDMRNLQPSLRAKSEDSPVLRVPFFDLAQVVTTEQGAAFVGLFSVPLCHEHRLAALAHPRERASRCTMTSSDCPILVHEWSHEAHPGPLQLPSAAALGEFQNASLSAPGAERDSGLSLHAKLRSQADLWQQLQLLFLPRWPIPLLISSANLECYNALFQFLLETRHLHFELQRLWLDGGFIRKRQWCRRPGGGRARVSPRGAAGARGPPAEAREETQSWDAVWMLRARMTFLLGHVLQHLLTVVVQPAFRHLQNVVRESVDFDQIKCSHDSFLLQLASKCWLRLSSLLRPFLQSLQSVRRFVEVFGCLVERHTATLRGGPSRTRDGSGRSHALDASTTSVSDSLFTEAVMGVEEWRVVRVKLRAIQDELHRGVLGFFAELAALRQNPLHAQLDALMVDFDFNGFFSKLSGHKLLGAISASSPQPSPTASAPAATSSSFRVVPTRGPSAVAASAAALDVFAAGQGPSRGTPAAAASPMPQSEAEAWRDRAAGSRRPGTPRPAQLSEDEETEEEPDEESGEEADSVGAGGGEGARNGAEGSFAFRWGGDADSDERSGWESRGDRERKRADAFEWEDGHGFMDSGAAFLRAHSSLSRGPSAFERGRQEARSLQRPTNAPFSLLRDSPEAPASRCPSSAVPLPSFASVSHSPPSARRALVPPPPPAPMFAPVRGGGVASVRAPPEGGERRSSSRECGAPSAGRGERVEERAAGGAAVAPPEWKPRFRGFAADRPAEENAPGASRESKNCVGVHDGSHGARGFKETPPQPTDASLRHRSRDAGAEGDYMWDPNLSRAEARRDRARGDAAAQDTTPHALGGDRDSFCGDLQARARAALKEARERAAQRRLLQYQQDSPSWS
ncbi:hypothetical protein BESB_024100 [Besnoitia besnoiti]|uniref:Spc97 / Spc98 family protein n=1 Tax=Besnoitia besnoiti TaxID=94643 RepID=A0A2A9LZY8_BESBE|nr:hypothetical protein BESB_024100 [Besnoitia besnoiti]PFH31918.1 hypothetical protein BESB_024100 [Besnoitia besnoiti]